MRAKLVSTLDNVRQRLTLQAISNLFKDLLLLRKRYLEVLELLPLLDHLLLIADNGALGLGLCFLVLQIASTRS